MQKQKNPSSSTTLSAVNLELKLMQMLPSDCMINQQRQTGQPCCAAVYFTAVQCVPLSVPVYSSHRLLALAAGADGEHHVSYLLDGFQSGHCGERCGGHFTNVHVHVAAVFADSHH